MDGLKEFIAWLEEYLSEGHRVIATSCVIHELKKTLGALEEGKKEEI